MHDVGMRGLEDVGAKAELVERRAMLSRARGKIMVEVLFFILCACKDMQVASCG